MGMTVANNHDLASKIERIELLVLDVDGVLTDGLIAVDDHGVETKHFYVRDGAGIKIWREAGLKVAILSGRSARCVDVRAKELEISPVIQGSRDKGRDFLAIAAGFGLRADQACHVGDDLVDLPAFALAGLSACPSDAAAEVRDGVDLVTRAPGGRGAVREVVEWIMRGQGRWESAVASFAANG